MGRLKDNMVPFITEDEIDDISTELAKEIDRDYDGRELVIVCPLQGSIIFLADFVRKLKIPCEIDFVYLTSPKGKGVKILKDIQSEIQGKHVLICEEIIDAGRTLSFLKTRLANGDPASVKVLTLIDKPSRREIPLNPDYVGKTIQDRFVVGYGMDSEEIGRNYKDIYIFAQ